MNNVEEQFWRLETRGITGRFTFRTGANETLPGLTVPLNPIDDSGGHIQGFARVPGFRDSDWFVASRNNTQGRPAGLLFIELHDLVGWGGHRLVPPWVDRDAFWLSDDAVGDAAPPLVRTARVFRHISETRHPGGIQVIGHIVVVPSYCIGPNEDGCKKCVDEGGNERACAANEKPKRRAFVDFIELRECQAESDDACVCGSNPIGWCPIRVNRLYLSRGGLSGLFDRERKAYYVAVTRMNNGRYVVVANRTNSGKFDVYTSSNTTIDENTQWGNRDREQFIAGFDNFSDTYQNMNFVTDCGTGELFLLGFSHSGWDDNELDLFRAWAKESGELDLDRLGRIEPPTLNDSCEMKGGAGAYVTPNHNLILYCSQGRVRTNHGQKPGFLTFSEIATADSFEPSYIFGSDLPLLQP